MKAKTLLMLIQEVHHLWYFSVTDYLKLHNAIKLYLEYSFLPGIMFMFYNAQPFSLTLVD